MTRVIIESPYAGDIERNTLYARRAMRDSIMRGEAPFASHLLYTQPGILDENNPDERQLGIQLGYEHWYGARMVVFYIDYEMSPGMLKAADRAQTTGKQIEYRKIGENPNARETTASGNHHALRRP